MVFGRFNGPISAPTKRQNGRSGRNSLQAPHGHARPLHTGLQYASRLPACAPHTVLLDTSRTTTVILRRHTNSWFHHYDTSCQRSTCFHDLSIIPQCLDILFAFPPHTSPPSSHIEHSSHIPPSHHCLHSPSTTCSRSPSMHCKLCTKLYHHTPQHI